MVASGNKTVSLVMVTLGLFIPSSFQLDREGLSARSEMAELDSLSSATANQVTITANRRWHLGWSVADCQRQSSSASRRRTPALSTAPATMRSAVAIAASGHRSHAAAL